MKVLKEIEILRSKLNIMVAENDAVLYSGEILKLSQKLDKLIVLYQWLLIIAGIRFLSKVS